MSVLMSGGRADPSGSTRGANALGPRHNQAEVVPLLSPEPLEICDSLARPRRPANAACRDMGPELFFPANSAAFARAERFCATCPGAPECLSTALEDQSLHGIWAGTSAKERQYLRSEEGLGWG